MKRETINKVTKLVSKETDLKEVMRKLQRENKAAVHFVAKNNDDSDLVYSDFSVLLPTDRIIYLQQQIKGLILAEVGTALNNVQAELDAL